MTQHNFTTKDLAQVLDVGAIAVLQGLDNVHRRHHCLEGQLVMIPKGPVD
jgi:hypothetical protein